MNSKSVAAECNIISHCAECLATLTIHSLQPGTVERAGNEIAQRIYVDSVALAVHGFCTAIALRSKDIAEVLNADDDCNQPKQDKVKPVKLHPVDKGTPNE